MIDERYSAAAFEAAGVDTRQAAELAAALQQEVLTELETPIREHLLRIIDRLNGMGHDLHPYTPLVAGELTFRDEAGQEGTESYRCRLRLALDYLVSAGYAHLRND
jgi:hypothetical protein